MGLQLIIGGSGTGKSHLMYTKLLEHSVDETGGKCYAIVPEQFTMETQKTIVELSEHHGTMNIDIVSFDRLAKRIFSEAGLSTLKVLDDTGKCLVLRKIIEENKEQFTVFGTKAGMAGFIEEMKSMISELYQYGIANEKFETMMENAQKRPLLYAKLKDIRLILEKFKEYFNERFIINEELLQKVRMLIGESEIMKDSFITFDEYTGFSPVQYEVIRQLLKYAKEVCVTITLRDAHVTDYAKENEADVFSLSIKTINKLKMIAREENVQIYSDIILTQPQRLKDNKMISYLESNLFKYGVKPYKTELKELTKSPEQSTGNEKHDNVNNSQIINGQDNGKNSQIINGQDNAKSSQIINGQDNAISIHICDNPVAEAEYAAYTICRLVRCEHYRYKDIAVVTADIEGYDRYIMEAFEKHDIPCFVDSKRSVIANPMVETIRAVLEVVSDNFSYESVFRYLRCGMSGLSGTEIDLLENYVISHGIRGKKKWLTPIEDEREEYEIARQKVLADLFETYEVFKAKRRILVRDAITELSNLVFRLDLKHKLEIITKHFYDEGDLSRGNEFKQTYGLVMELFEKIIFLTGDEKANAGELLAMLDSGFEEIKVGLVPPTLDRVVVGDIERTRLGKVKILFLIGANDGVIPKSDASGGVLTREERNFLQESGIELSPTARENAFIQRFYLYLVLTKMSEKLLVSFVRSGADGASKRQSYIVTSIASMFKNLNVVDESKAERDSLPKSITNIRTTVSYVSKNIYDFISGRLSEEEKRTFCELYTMCVRNGIKMEPILHAAAYSLENSRLDRAVARALYGENLLNSVSRLETFAACAYRHFLTYGLQLVPRKEYGIQKNDIGNVYHSAIELFFKKVREKELSFDQIDDEMRKRLIHESVTEAAANESGVFYDNGRNAYMLEKIIKVSEKTVWILQQQINAGDFIPSEFEMRFSSQNGLDEMKYVYDDGAQMGLRGVIDRVDYYRDQDDIYVKIIDYKSGTKKFEINDVYNGLQLQLILYMEAALELTKKKHPGKNVIPGGMFYYNIDDPVIKEEDLKNWESAEELKDAANEAVLKNQKVNGIVNDDEKVMKAFDHAMDELKANGGESMYIPVGYTKKGTYKNGSSQADALSINCMINFVHEKTGKFGKEILDGAIELNPYKKSDSNESKACDYCDYKSVCGFDQNLAGAKYRLLYKNDPEDVWENIRKESNHEKREGEKNGNLD